MPNKRAGRGPDAGRMGCPTEGQTGGADEVPKRMPDGQDGCPTGLDGVPDGSHVIRHVIFECHVTRLGCHVIGHIIF